MKGFVEDESERSWFLLKDDYNAYRVYVAYYEEGKNGLHCTEVWTYFPIDSEFEEEREHSNRIDLSERDRIDVSKFVWRPSNSHIFKRMVVFEWKRGDQFYYDMIPFCPFVLNFPSYADLLRMKFRFALQFSERHTVKFAKTESDPDYLWDKKSHGFTHKGIKVCDGNFVDVLNYRKISALRCPELKKGDVIYHNPKTKKVFRACEAFDVLLKVFIMTEIFPSRLYRQRLMKTTKMMGY